jgi:ATP-dependent DNA ligase
MAFATFDLLELDGYTVMGEPWTARRKRLEDLLEAPPTGICLVPVTEDALALWDSWVGMGGEGNRAQGADLALPTRRPLACLWLKCKPKLTLDARIPEQPVMSLPLHDASTHLAHEAAQLRQLPLEVLGYLLLPC